MKTPILFIVFNRPIETKRVFESIRQAQPEELYIVADGPRSQVKGEMEKCDEVREIVKNVDWPCSVHTNFQNENLGCRKNVSGAINWFFENVEEGIILEDDCLPDPSFFGYASVLLATYRDDKQIMHISGTQFQFGNKRGDGSYYFSHCVHIWGWATWRRAWKYYDVDMKDLGHYSRSEKIYSLFNDRRVADFWISLFKHIKHRHIDTWDAQWAFAVMRSEGLAITPNVNLIENIGFGGASTHTGKEFDTAHQPSQKIEMLIHPSKIEADKEADTYLAYKMYIESIWTKIGRRIKGLFK